MEKIETRTNMRTALFAVAVAATFILMTMPDAHAATTGSVFQLAYTTLVGWVQGYGGKVFAVLAFFVGLGVAAWTKSLLPPLLGIGIAFLVAYGIPIIEGVATATI